MGLLLCLLSGLIPDGGEVNPLRVLLRRGHPAVAVGTDPVKARLQQPAAQFLHLIGPLPVLLTGPAPAAVLPPGENIHPVGTDIASLFGNALDNAIEKELTENTERRFISLSVKEENGFIYIHIDNYCSSQIEFEDGFPKTTKKDTRYHGFGTKSISNIVNKYSGELIMSVDDERFNLDILFPVAVRW